MTLITAQWFKRIFSQFLSAIIGPSVALVFNLATFSIFICHSCLFFSRTHSLFFPLSHCYPLHMLHVPLPITDTLLTKNMKTKNKRTVQQVLFPSALPPRFIPQLWFGSAQACVWRFFYTVLFPFSPHLFLLNHNNNNVNKGKKLMNCYKIIFLIEF